MLFTCPAGQVDLCETGYVCEWSERVGLWARGRPAAAGPLCSQGEVFVRNRAGGDGCQRKPV